MAEVMLNTVVFMGSAREGRLGTCVLNHVVGVLKARTEKVVDVEVSHEVTVFDPIEVFGKDGALEGDGHLSTPHSFLPPGTKPKQDEMAAKIKAADCYVIVTCEYNNTVPPALTSMINHFSPALYRQKPSAIVTYSPAPYGGVRAAMAARQFLPEVGCSPVSKVAALSGPAEYLNPDGTPSDSSARMLKQVPALLTELEWAAVASKKMRDLAAVGSPAPKNVASRDPEWTVIYHGIKDGKSAFKGRKEPILMLLEDAGVAYIQTSEGIAGPEGYCDAFRGPLQAEVADVKKGASNETVAKQTAPFPVMFPPIIWHRPVGKKEVFVNHSMAVVRYISKQLGYIPVDVVDQAHCDQVCLDVFDFISEGRRQFHPVEDGASYSSQKEEGDKASKKWSERRLGVWLQHYEKILEKTGHDGAGFLFGSKVSCADIVLFYGLEACIAQFNTDFYSKVWDNMTTIPRCKKFVDFMKQRPNLGAYLVSDRRAPWAGDSLM